LGLTSFAQGKDTEYIEVSFIVPWRTATITLVKGTTEIYSTTSDSTTVLIYQDLDQGFYKLSVTDSANNSEYRDSIFVKKGQKITANIGLESICPYDYHKQFIPTCTNGHKDGILEIRYRNERDRGKNKKYYLVGYTAKGCVPRFFCTIHKFKF
jgi:hypothetical protein